jgi:hypothetical protein
MCFDYYFFLENLIYEYCHTSILVLYVTVTITFRDSGVPSFPTVQMYQVICHMAIVFYSVKPESTLYYMLGFYMSINTW